VFSGLFWSGEQAVKLGVADRTGNLQTLMRELKVDNKVDYTIERNPFETILGRMGSEFGQGVAASLSQHLQTEQQAKLQ
ncbi:MAG: S49 family peptidase, partial [Acinetobacter sp.]